MQFPDQKNISFCLVGKNLSEVTNATLVNSPDTLSDGQIALLTKDNASFASGSLVATDVVRFVQRSGNELIFTPWFKVGDATCALSGYTVSSEQVSYIGYNGTSGSIDVINNNNYVIKIHLKDFNRGSIYEKFGAYKSPTSGTTQAAVAKGLFESLVRQFANEPVKLINFERTSNGTLADFTGTATMLKFTKGSKTVLFVDAAAAASTGTIAVGDVINIPSGGGKSFSFTASALGSGSGNHVIYIGTTSYTVADAGTDAQNATAIAAAINAGTLATAAVTSSTTVTITYAKGVLTPPPVVYNDNGAAFIAVTITTGDSVPVTYVAATAATAAASFELDEYYQGETGYAPGGTTNATNTGVLSTITLYGIKFTGVAHTFVVDKTPYQKVGFTLGLSNFTSTEVTYTSAYVFGKNTSEQIAELESFSKYNNGKTLRGYYLASDALTMDTVTNVKYEVATINAKKTVDSGLGIPMNSPFTIYLAFYKDSNQGDGIATRLNTYYSSGSFPA